MILTRLILVTTLIVIGGATLGIKAQKANPTSVTTETINLQSTSTDSTLTDNIVSPGRSGPVIKTTQLDLSQNREVYIYGEIDENNSPNIARQILELGKDSKPINILINSPGGSVLDGALIISAMEAASGPVNTICVQLCASMAAMIHQYGTHRLMLNRSLLMFHPASGGVQGETDKMYSRLSTFKAYIGKMENNVAKRSKMTYEAYKAKSGVEWWVDAEDSIAVGLSDGIVYVRGSAASKVFLENKVIATKGNVYILPKTPTPKTFPVVVPERPQFFWY